MPIVEKDEPAMLHGSGGHIRRTYSPWRCSEERYLTQHRTMGADLIAYALGRSVGSVKSKAHRLGISLTQVPGETCPICGERDTMPNTEAAKHGMCLVCWERRKAEVMRDKAAEERAKREYDAAKHRLHGKKPKVRR